MIVVHSLSNQKEVSLFIDTQEELESFIARACTSSVIALDTEFMREKSYYPQLCLLQIATDDEIAIIDPLAVTDLRGLAEPFADTSIVKIMHAGRQDLEIMFNQVGALPDPVFDTQIAATLMGHVQQIGLAPLISSICGVHLKKRDSYTDWTRRPLSKSQIAYAADDVRYLPDVYRFMKQELEAAGRLSWLDDDFKELSNPQRYISNDRELFRKLKRVNQLSIRQLSAAREVTAWREQRAKERDIPRKWVLADEQIVEACKREPRTIDELFMVRGISERLSTNDARAVVQAICTGLDLEPALLPTVDKPSKNEASVEVEVDALTAIARLRAKEHNIALQTLAPHGDLVDVARRKMDSPVLHGWRREIVGNDLLSFMNGTSTLSCRNGNLIVTTQAPDASCVQADS